MEQKYRSSTYKKNRSTTCNEKVHGLNEIIQNDMNQIMIRVKLDVIPNEMMS